MTSRIAHNDPRKEGAFSLTYHYEMLADAQRVEPFLKVLRAECPGRIVFESGTGSGVLSILAAKSGAKRVFCTEIDPRVASFARENIARSGFSDRITLIPKSTLEVAASDLSGLRPDIIMAENLSTWQVTEPQNQVMNHLRSDIAGPSAIAIPARADNYVELCEAKFSFWDAVELRSHYFEFTGIDGPKIKSRPVLFCSFDYSQRVPTVVNNEMIVTADQEGVINALRLTSPLVLGANVSFSSSDSLMPPVVVPLERDVAVRAGERLRVRVRYETNTTWDAFLCEAIHVS